MSRLSRTLPQFATLGAPGLSRTLLAVGVWVVFIVLVVMAVGQARTVSDIGAALDANKSAAAQDRLSIDARRALEAERASAETTLSVTMLGVFVLGLTAFHFVRPSLARKVGFVLLTVVLVTFATFTILRIMPGDPFQAMANDLVRERGLNYDDALKMAYTMLDYDPEKPFLIGFVEYLGSVLRFDLGESWQYKVPVNQIIAQALPWTLLVLSISLALSFALGTLLGMIIAWKRRTALDPIITFYAAFTGATPDYVTALVLMIIFAVNLRWFPIAGGYDPRLAPGFNWPFIASVISHSTLPVIAYTFENTAAWALAMKGSAVSVLGEDYITAARARGLRGRRILTAYVGRNAMLPMITALAISLGTMLGGSTLIENIYSYPGIGRFNADALTRRDVGLMQGLFLFQAIAIILANFFADLIYTRLDPRIKLED